MSMIQVSYYKCFSVSVIVNMCIYWMPFKVKHLPIPNVKFKFAWQPPNVHEAYRVVQGNYIFTVYARVSMQMILPLHLLGVHVALHSIFREDSVLLVPRTLRCVICTSTDFPNPCYIVTDYPSPCIIYCDWLPYPLCCIKTDYTLTLALSALVLGTGKTELFQTNRCKFFL